MTDPADANQPTRIYTSIEERSVVDLINRRAVDMIELEERLRTMQLFDTTDADGNVIKRSKRFRKDSVDVQIMLERSRRYAEVAAEAERCAEIIGNTEMTPEMRVEALAALTKLRDQQNRELLGIEVHRVQMRRDYTAALQAAVKMLSDAAMIRQREQFHRDQIEVLKGKTVDVLSDAELEREAERHGEAHP